MSVTTTDLKSMLSKVRKHEGAPAAPASGPPAAAVMVATPALGAAVNPPPAAPAPTPEPTAAAAAAAAAAIEEQERYDVDSILLEINADEELLLRILGMLYRSKKRNPNGGAISIIDMEKQLGLVRESGTFVINYMKARKLIETNDKSANMITVEGIEYLRNKLTK